MMETPPAYVERVDAGEPEAGRSEAGYTWNAMRYPLFRPGERRSEALEYYEEKRRVEEEAAQRKKMRNRWKARLCALGISMVIGLLSVRHAGIREAKRRKAAEFGGMDERK